LVLPLPLTLKKLVSLTLVALLLLNILGYYGIFLGLQLKKTQSMIQRFDAADYDDDQTIAFKIPLALPYAGESKGFIRVDGQFEHDGEFYRMIKQKLSNDTLTIIVFKDAEAKELHKAASNFVKSFTDKPAGSSSNAKMSPTFIKDYIQHELEIENQSNGWEKDLTNIGFDQKLTPTFYSSIIHPPERV